MRTYITFFLVLFFLYSCKQEKPKLTLYVGAASQPATEEIIEIFTKETGINVDANFGGSGTMLSQLILSKNGDIYFPGSSDFMELAKEKGVVDSCSETIICYLVSAINVAKGNPKGIYELKDLLRKDIRVAIANPENVCVGTYAVELLENNFSEEQIEIFREGLVNYTESCSRTATAVSLHSVDAVIGWRVFQYWDPERIQTVSVPADQLCRVGYIPVALTKFSKNKSAAEKFLNFLQSRKAKEIFKKYHYFTSLDEVSKYTGIELPVGGRYPLPEKWKE